MEGVWRQNPVFVMVLGHVPDAGGDGVGGQRLSMGLATTFVLVFSCWLVSLMRNIVPKEVRIATYIVIIATFVTVVDYVIQAISLALYDALGAFIQLIVVNCIILGRAEAHASKHPPLLAMVNALGMGAGFTIGLFALGGVREILGNGSAVRHVAVRRRIFSPGWSWCCRRAASSCSAPGCCCSPGGSGARSRRNPDAEGQHHGA